MMEDQNEVIDNWNPILLEYPFVRKGMTAQEYDEEKAYYYSVPLEDHKTNQYVPLWKQRETLNIS